MWRVADYHYDLPPEQIAQTPCDRRDASRLLHLDPAGGLADRVFTDLADLLPAGAVLVVNDTRVIPARLAARKATGGAVELFLLEPVDPARPAGPWTALARASKPLRAGAGLELLDAAGQPAGVTARIVADRAADGTVTVELDQPPLEVVDRIGEVPLPPYIERAAGDETRASDRERYQTVYAAAPGAVAAPTAG